MQPSNTWEFSSPVSVEAFPSRGALDVDDLFQQEFLRSPGLVDHRCVLPVDGMVAPPGMLRHHRLLQKLGLACLWHSLHRRDQAKAGIQAEGTLGITTFGGKVWLLVTASDGLCVAIN